MQGLNLTWNWNCLSTRATIINTVFYFTYGLLPNITRVHIGRVAHGHAWNLPFSHYLAIRFTIRLLILPAATLLSVHWPFLPPADPFKPQTLKFLFFVGVRNLKVNRYLYKWTNKKKKKLWLDTMSSFCIPAVVQVLSHRYLLYHH